MVLWREDMGYGIGMGQRGDIPLARYDDWKDELESIQNG